MDIKEEIRSTYDILYSYPGEEVVPYGTATHRYPRFLKYLKANLPPPATILDASCGRGLLARQLIAQGYVVSVTENSLWLVNNDLKDLNPILAGYEDLPAIYKNRSFDAVISSDVLEHLPTIEEAQNAIGILANLSCKYVLISVGLLHSEKYYTKKIKLPMQHLHLVCPGYDKWRSMISKYIHIKFQDKILIVRRKPYIGFFFGIVR